MLGFGWEIRWVDSSEGRGWRGRARALGIAADGPRPRPRSGGCFGGPVTDRGLGDLTATQTPGADPDASRGAVDPGTHALEVRLEAAKGDVVGVTDLAPGHRTFVTNLTSFGHDSCSHPSKEFSFRSRYLGGAALRSNAFRLGATVFDRQCDRLGSDPEAARSVQNGGDYQSSARGARLEGLKYA